MNHFKKNFTVGNRQATIEYGEIGRQANATVIVNMEDTVVMSALTANREHKSEATFLPLTVDYQEKYYAAGAFRAVFFAVKVVRRKRKFLYHALLTVPSARCSLIFSITKCRYCPRCFHIIPKWTVIFRQCWPPMPPCIYPAFRSTAR